MNSVLAETCRNFRKQTQMDEIGKRLLERLDTHGRPRVKTGQWWTGDMRNGVTQG